MINFEKSQKIVFPNENCNKELVVAHSYSHSRCLNIAGRLPENSRNSFVDLQSQKKNSKKERPKKFVFLLKTDMLYFDKESVLFFAASISCSHITFI